jgi:hypothetical protein
MASLKSAKMALFQSAVNIHERDQEHPPILTFQDECE